MPNSLEGIAITGHSLNSSGVYSKPNMCDLIL